MEIVPLFAIGANVKSPCDFSGGNAPNNATICSTCNL